MFGLFSTYATQYLVVCLGSFLQSRVIILDVKLQNYDSLPTKNSALRLSLTGDDSLHIFVTFSIRLNYIALQTGKHFSSLTTFLFLPITSVSIIYFPTRFYNGRVIDPGSWGHRFKSKRGLRNVVGTKNLTRSLSEGSRLL